MKNFSPEYLPKLTRAAAANCWCEIPRNYEDTADFIWVMWLLWKLKFNVLGSYGIALINGQIWNCYDRNMSTAKGYITLHKLNLHIQDSLLWLLLWHPLKSSPKSCNKTLVGLLLYWNVRHLFFFYNVSRFSEVLFTFTWNTHTIKLRAWTDPPLPKDRWVNKWSFLRTGLLVWCDLKHHCVL